jgi:hypothetical protein
LNPKNFEFNTPSLNLSGFDANTVEVPRLFLLLTLVVTLLALALF